jgi:hypothetical protein
MAPTVDRSVVRFPSQVGSAGTFGCGRPKRPGEITENRSGIRAKALCHSSRVKGATRPLRGGRCGRRRRRPGGRLAQLVRALP